MIDISKIKLIIWDLDDTLWQGTLSEGGAVLPNEHRQLIIDLTDAGIMNSICSKNEYEPTMVELKKLSIWDYFVFASINWENKGQRVKNIIDQMALRPINVLFIDDNTFNLQEAKHYLPELQIATPDCISGIIEQVKLLDKKDATHRRLKQYKVLEEKVQAAESYDSNEAFLYASNIRVTIHQNCVDIIERLHELIVRSNQLNFTKKRISLEELSAIIVNPEYECGYVSVTDNFGDYGVVGFYAKTDNRLDHFVFSCRTMGQMIEQYVYALLGFPKLEVVGEVRTQLNTTDCPAWINQTNRESHVISTQNTISCKILLKGPCDLSNSQSYIHADGIVSEFTYVKESTGQVIDAYNHSVHIRGLHEYSADINQQLIDDCSFVDPDMLSGSFFTGDYDVIFLSSLIESTIPIYKKKNTNILVAYNDFYQKASPDFFDKYEYVGMTTSEQYENFLVDCLSWLPQKTTLCIILGVTTPIFGETDILYHHKEINSVVKKMAAHNNRLKYIDVNDFVKTSKDVTDNINHYQTRVYYEIAQAMISVINETTNIEVKSVNKAMVLLIRMTKQIRPFVKRILSSDSKLYHNLQTIYFKVIKKKSNIK